MYYYFYCYLGLCYINHICAVLKYLCKIKSTVVVTNLAVKYCDFTNKINDVKYQQIEQMNIRPAIGKYWFHIPNTRLMLTTINKQQISINIGKSVYLPLNEKCMLIIDDCGVS